MIDQKSFSDTLNILIGDTPVSEQLDAALNHMALKEHMHCEYATRDEIEELKKKVETLLDLVGDTSVANQISVALNSKAD